MNKLNTISTTVDEYYEKEINKEPILDKENTRFCLEFPLKYNNLWNLYKKQQSAFWKAEEIDFSQDYKDWVNLNEDEQYVIKMILAFFANTDGIVNLNISSTFLNDITIIEAKMAYTYQMMMENIHSETYSLMLDNLIRDNKEKKYLFDAIHTIPSINIISDWALKWVENKQNIAYKIIAFACVEGIFFSGAFATIFWLKKYKGSGKMFMPGLIKSNEFIARDEGMHTDFACELYQLIINKPDKNEVYNIIKESVEIAKIFSTESIKCKLVGLNSELMNQYIEYVADRLSISLGYEKIYKVNNPFTFMDSIGMLQKTNFHEQRPSEYQSAHIGGDKSLEIEDDF
jgi:ribonucleotide reductase beta subunit family protein with ferritin-like domain